MKMATFPFRNPGRSPADRHISGPFSKVMLALACFLVFSVAVCLAGFRYVMINSLLKSTANNYARFCAEEIGELIGAGADPDHWQRDLEGLGLILDRVMRVEGIVKLQVLDRERLPVAERTAEAIPPGIVRGEYEIRFNDQPQGWLAVSLAVPDLNEAWGSLGFFSIAPLATLISHNYAVLVSGQISSMMKDGAGPEMWEYDADKLAKILAGALRLDGIATVAIFDKQGRLVSEEGNRTKALSGVRADIVYNNDVIGHAQVYLDFPGIRRTGLILQLLVLFLGLLLGGVIYLVPVRVVRRLEHSLVALNSKLEAKVEQRTARIREINYALEKELAGRAKLEASLIQAEKLSAIGKLAAGIAHDFNNLLTAIIGNAGFLLSGLAKDDPGINDAKEILVSAERAAGLTQQLLAFSRRQILDPRIMDLNTCVGGMVGMLRRLISEEIVIETVFAPRPCIVRVDQGQIGRVLMNLAVNARDAMPGGGTLTLKTELIAGDADLYLKHPDLPRGPLGCLTVRDTGTFLYH